MDFKNRSLELVTGGYIKGGEWVATEIRQEGGAVEMERSKHHLHGLGVKSAELTYDWGRWGEGNVKNDSSVNGLSK